MLKLDEWRPRGPSTREAVAAATKNSGDLAIWRSNAAVPLAAVAMHIVRDALCAAEGVNGLDSIAPEAAWPTIAARTGGV